MIGARLIPPVDVLALDRMPLHGGLAPIYFTQLRLDGPPDIVPPMEQIQDQDRPRWELLKAYCNLWGVRVRYHPHPRRFDVEYKGQLVDIGMSPTMRGTIRRLYSWAKTAVRVHEMLVMDLEKRLGPDGVAAVNRLRGE